MRWQISESEAPDVFADLYQMVILDHKKHPRNFRAMENADETAEGHNRVCGDQLKLYLVVDAETAKDISFHGSCCAVSKASASMMRQAVKGQPWTRPNPCSIIFGK